MPRHPQHTRRTRAAQSGARRAGGARIAFAHNARGPRLKPSSPCRPQAPRAASVRPVSIRARSVITRATVVSRGASAPPLLPRGHVAERCAPRRSQDKEKVLSDVRSIISEQLGTEIEKVRAGARSSRALPGPVRRADGAPPPPPQVAADSKFVDLGADSLDTVSSACRPAPLACLGAGLGPRPSGRPRPQGFTGWQVAERSAATRCRSRS